MHNITSPRTDDGAIEQEIQAKGKTAPRVTPTDVEAEIVSEHYFTAAQGDAKAQEDAAFVGGSLNGAQARPIPQALHLLTFCVLVLRNGFTVTGESACASPENFDAEIGRRIARANAEQKIWPLLGFRLRDKLASQPADFRDRVRAEAAELDDRLAKLDAFLNTDTYRGLAAEEKDRLCAQRDAMDAYSDALHERIAAF